MKISNVNSYPQTPAAYVRRTTCRVCGSRALTSFWTAGDTYVVGFPEKPDVNLLKAPLTLCVCEECWLVQLQDTVKSDLLYREFWYRSATNEMMRKELKEIAREAYRYLSGSTKVEHWALDIGCNDGQLLDSYPIDDDSLHRVGIDPAKNIQAPGRQPSGWWFVNDYFARGKVLEGSLGGRYDIVTAIAMLYDLENPVAFVKEVRDVLAPEGVFVVQMNYLPTMLENNCVDNICHEHLTYYSLTTLVETFQRAGLEIYQASLNSTNGGSLRVFAGHPSQRRIDQSVSQLLEKEQDEQRLLSVMYPYQRFNMNIKNVCQKLNDWMDCIIKSGKTIYAYGASTRGTTLLQLLNTKDKITAVAERDPNKYGRYMVGGWLPIVPEAEARAKADYFLMLPHHFAPAIIEREKEWLNNGGRFIIPLPEPTIYGKLFAEGAALGNMGEIDISLRSATA